MMEHLKFEMSTWEVDFTKEAEKKVYDAVIVLFEKKFDILFIIFIQMSFNLNKT